MEEKPKKKLHLTRKQFIIGIVAICGIALIIESVLLIRTFAKRQEKGKSDGNNSALKKVAAEVKKPESYTRKIYIAGSKGEKELTSIKSVEYDSDGRLCREYYRGVTYYQGNPYVEWWTTNIEYYYDESDRVVLEDWNEIIDWPRKNETHETKRKISYTYKDGNPSEVFIRSVDENGILVYTVEEKYNDAGVCISRIKQEFFNGTSYKTEDIAYNDRGDILTADYIRVTSDGKVWETEKDQYSYYASGIRKTLLEQQYDGAGLLKKSLECSYNEYGAEISRTVLYRGEWRQNFVYDENERKVTPISEDGIKYYGIKYYDETGRIVLERRYDGDTEYFYPGETAKAAIRRTSKSGEKSREILYDAEGRIVQENSIEPEGKTEIYFDWNYMDPKMPRKNVLKRTKYKDGRLVQKTLYLVHPVAESEKEEWCWSYGVLKSCRHNAVHNGVLCDIMLPRDICEDYLSPYGQYHLEKYLDVKYSADTGRWETVLEAETDLRGEIRSVWVSDSQWDEVHEWEYDDHGNQIRAESRRADSIIETIICEYTYYTASPEAENR